MKRLTILKFILAALVLPVSPGTFYSYTVSAQAPVQKYGALAIDRNNGYFFGFKADGATLSEAVRGAIEECTKKGGKCTVVLSYSGTGCVAYRCSAGTNVGLAFGWGVARTKEEADKIAVKECSVRSFGTAAPVSVWSCNSPNSGELKIIYNATKEIIHNDGDADY